MNSILIIGTQHGDERLGTRVQRALQRDTSGRFKNVDYICGNPKAYRQNVRFIESDLNRSYGVDHPVTYEQRRARKILKTIAEKQYDYVLDIHTSRADVGRFLLVNQLSASVRQIIGASGFGRVAMMPPHIADCSLIGQVPQAVSIEYDRKLAKTPQALEEMLRFIENLAQGKVQKAEREVYYVDGTIPNDTTLRPDSKNFELADEGFYPVIFRPDGGSYTKYRGFTAHKKNVLVV